MKLKPPHDKVLSLTPPASKIWVVVHNEETPPLIEVHPVLSLALVEEYSFTGKYNDDGPEVISYHKIVPIFLADVGHPDKNILGFIDPVWDNILIYTYLYEYITTEEAVKRFGSDIASDIQEKIGLYYAEERGNN